MPVRRRMTVRQVGRWASLARTTWCRLAARARLELHAGESMVRAILSGNHAQQAGTLMHEFGHTLGLEHGGNDGLNNKPNYPSVMNYTWQSCSVPNLAASVPGGCDYSRVKLPPGTGLNETGLDECQGIDGGALGRLQQ